MNTPKQIIAAVAAVLLAGNALADDMRDVIRINFNDGTSDYILASDVKKISFSKGVDAESAAYQATATMFDSMKQLFQLSELSHADFGYPAMMLGMDMQTPYMISQDTAYEWFARFAKFENAGLYANCPNVMMWRYCYTYISEANTVLNALPSPANDEERLLAAQGHALRSFAYWNLAQSFAHNYFFAPEALCVPLIPENLNDGLTSGAKYPIATTRKVYAQIMTDIDKAIGYLSDNTLNPAYIDVANAKRYIDLSVAFGLRARYNLTMHNYAEAAADARSAIDASSATPLLYEMAGYPGFNNAKLGNWMWGITVEETDRAATSGIVNWASHLSSLNSTGYASFGTYRACTNVIWDYLQSHPTDVRANWFAGSNYHSSLLTFSQNKLLTTYRTWSLQHPNLKFDTYKSNIYGVNQAGDIPLMRIEEMYLIEAEGLVMGGSLSEGIARLNDFVQTYRDPSFSVEGSTAADIQSEIIHQRALELWGEGLSYFDMLRLQLDLDRFACANSFPTTFYLRIHGGSDLFLYRYPNLPPYAEGYDYEQTYPVPTPGNTWND